MAMREGEMLGHRSPWASPVLRTPRRFGPPPPIGLEEEEEEEYTTELGTPRRAELMRGERKDLPGFATPLRVTVMGRQRDMLDFRTPQHPSMASNNWGGASPLLARNIPKESLDTKYLRLNTVRTRDEIFPMADLHPVAAAPGRPGRGLLGRRLFSKLKWKGRNKTEVVLMGAGQKRSRWLPELDYRSRWPQGWC